MTDTHRLVDHLFRERAGQMVAWLTRAFGPAYLDLAEEVVQDALVKALQQWPYTGVPANPGGWLFQVARNRALDVVRRNAAFRERATQVADYLGRHGEAPTPPEHAIADDELRMIFLCCHPGLPADGRVALSLKTAGGFGVQEIARAFLTNEAVINQRITRAKRRLRELDPAFDLPGQQDLDARVDSVLEVIYLLFNEGYAAHRGEDLIRLDVCSEALRLARLVAGNPATATPAAHALLALIAFQAARLPARVDDQGDIVLLEAQVRARWDPRLTTLGFIHLEQSASGDRRTPYHVQAAIAAAHASASTAADTPWDLIVRLYDELMALTPTPVIALNRVVALWKAQGTGAALNALREIEAEPALEKYYLLPAVKGRLLAAGGDVDGARAAFELALGLPCSAPEQRLLCKYISEL